MKTDIQGRSNCRAGCEKYEEFMSPFFRGTRIQYDYRHPCGKLFSTVSKTLEEARRRRNIWLQNHGLS